MQITLLSLLFIFSASAFARDCATESGNFHLGHKLMGRLTHFAEENLADPCSKEESDWEESRKAFLKMRRVIRDELDRKKTVSSSFFLDINEAFSKDELTESELCSLIDKKMDKDFKSSCSSRVLQDKLRTTSFVDMPYKDACRAIWDDVKNSRTKCMEEAQKVAKRDPPGEEIAPAEEPDSTNTPQLEKAPSYFYGPRTIIKSRKTEAAPSRSGGASSQ